MYKKGDLIKGTRPANMNKPVNCDMELGEVYDVGKGRIVVKVLKHKDERYIGQLYAVINPTHFEVVGRATPGHVQILLTRDGDTVRAVELDRGVPVKTAKVKCDSRDEFNFRAGVELLLDKLGYHKPATEGDTEKKTEEKRLPKEGDFVRLTVDHGDGGLNKGDIAEVLLVSKVAAEAVYVRAIRPSTKYICPFELHGRGPFTFLTTGKYELVEK